MSDKSLEALVELPISLQLAFIRRTQGLSQAEIAKKMQTGQTFISALEKTKGHSFTQYEEFANVLGCKLAAIPRSVKLMFRKPKPGEK